jgi:hypothetical protein
MRRELRLRSFRSVAAEAERKKRSGKKNDQVVKAPLRTKKFNGVGAEQVSTANTPGEDVGSAALVSTSFVVPPSKL